MKHKKQKPIIEILDNLSKKEMSIMHVEVIYAGLLFETGNCYRKYFKKVKNSTISRTLKRVFGVLEKLSETELDSVLSDILPTQ